MIAGRYRLEREIGRGGSGTVHLALDEVLGRQVAIKRIGVDPRLGQRRASSAPSARPASPPRSTTRTWCRSSTWSTRTTSAGW